jgi:hypothetical protein
MYYLVSCVRELGHCIRELNGFLNTIPGARTQQANKTVYRCVNLVNICYMSSCLLVCSASLVMFAFGGAVIFS